MYRIRAHFTHKINHVATRVSRDLSLLRVSLPRGALHLCEERELLQRLQLGLPLPLLSLLQKAELMLEVAEGGLLRW